MYVDDVFCTDDITPFDARKARFRSLIPSLPAPVTEPPSLLTEDYYAGFLADEDVERIDADDQTRRELEERRHYWLNVVGVELDDLDFYLEEDGLADLPVISVWLDGQTEDDLAYTHRDEAVSDERLLHRWNRPDDELELLDLIYERNLQPWNVELLTAFRRYRLHKLLTVYFNSDDYMSRDIVTKWERRNGRWKPVTRENVLDWIDRLVEEKGSNIAGWYAAAQSVQRKMELRFGKDARYPMDGRVLSTWRVHQLATEVIEDSAYEATHAYDVTWAEVLEDFGISADYDE